MNEALFKIKYLPNAGVYQTELSVKNSVAGNDTNSDTKFHKVATATSYDADRSIKMTVELGLEQSVSQFERLYKIKYQVHEKLSQSKYGDLFKDIFPTSEAK